MSRRLALPVRRTMKTCLICAAAALTAQAVDAAPTAQRSQASAAAAITALGNAMPESVDVYPADPCAGPWDVKLKNGDMLMTLLVMRYRNVPLVHVTGPGLHPTNIAITRIDPRSIKVPMGETTVVLHVRRIARSRN